jgi:hypothetical protein
VAVPVQEFEINGRGDALRSPTEIGTSFAVRGSPSVGIDSLRTNSD